MSACATDRRPQGAALVIAMLVMAVLLLAGTTFMTISSTEKQIALNEQVSTKATLLAEAAMHKAIAQLSGNPAYTGETDTPLGDGTFTITASTVSGCTATSGRAVVATATVPVRGGEAQVQLRATADQVSYPFRWALFAAAGDLSIRRDSTVDSFDSTLGAYDVATNRGTAGDGLGLPCSSATVKCTGGNVGASEDVEIDENSQIGGNVTAGDDIDLESGVSVDGSQTTRAPSQWFPSLTMPGATGALVVLPFTTRTLDPADPLLGDPVNCNASTRTCTYTNLIILIGATLKTSGGPVTIYVRGNVNIGNDATLGAHPGTQLRIITRSDTGSPNFSAGDNFKFYGSLYGKNTDVQIGNNPRIYGSIVARKIKIGNQASIHFDQAMLDQEVCHNGKFNIRRGTWREVNQ
jgi:cytoskeletal protein CcmA (bactofilin family)